MDIYNSFNEMFSANCSASHLSVFNDCPENLRIYTPHSSAIAYFGPDETDPNAIAVCYKGKYTNPDTGEAIKGAVWVYSFRSPVMRNTQMKRIREAAANGYSIGKIVDEWKDMADYVNPDPAGNRTVEDQVGKIATGVEGDFDAEPALTEFATFDDAPTFTQVDKGKGKGIKHPRYWGIKKAFSGDAPNYDFGASY